MKLTIFTRLIIGYLAIFLLAMAVSIYAIAQLRQLENLFGSILRIDNRLLTYERKLSDVLLSLMRYEKKFVIMNDSALYDQFLLARKDFQNNLTNIMTVTDSPEVRNYLYEVEQQFDRYESLFENEVEFLKAGQEYANETFKNEKETSVNKIMDNLRNLRAYSHDNTYHKIKKLSEAEGKASKVAIVLGLASLITGICISIFMTINITRPLTIIKTRTKEISKGNFRNDLDLSSPPEISELAHSFNLMCTKLQAIDKMKSDFFSLMSHELRTPLTTIKEGTNLMIEGIDTRIENQKQKRLLTIIKEESDRLINLVNSLLDLSKMEAGMMPYNFTRADLSQLINQVAREIEPLAETKEIHINMTINGALPQIRVDRDRILQVLRNLIGNAVKFTPKGGEVKVSSSTLESAINISVADTGMGIPKDNLLTIFNKYEQVMNKGSNKIKGTGLGLSMVKHIIDAHGGKIWVESSLGQGSVFTFMLPV